MAQLPRPAAADVAAAMEEEAATWADVLDIDDCDMLLNSPSHPPHLHPSSATASHDDKPPHPSHHHRIPGPASAVQDTTRSRSDPGSPALGRADTRDADADFLLHPWQCALQFLGKDGAWEQPGIRVIKKDQALRRAPLVVGVVTSCKPNGLGDLTLTLKDPTDTIGASVHRKALVDEANGQDIAIGAVILLAKVAVFRPCHSSCYLNITKGKVVKVFRKGCDAPSKQIVSSNTAENQQSAAREGTRSESEGSTNSIMMRLLGCEGVMPKRSNKEMAVPDEETKQRSLAGGPSGGGHLQQNLNNPHTCSQPSLGGSSVMLGDRCTQASSNGNLRRSINDEQMLHCTKKLKSDPHLPGGNCTTGSSGMGTESEVGLETNMNRKPNEHGQHASVGEPHGHQRRDLNATNAASVQPNKEYTTDVRKSVSVTSVPGWTDEQLSELFADY